MTDPNIFDELMKLLNQPGPVNWALAEQISRHLIGERQPIDPWLAEEYIDLARLAHLQVGDASSLDAGPLVDTVPLDGTEWATRNLRSFGYLVEPIAEKVGNSTIGGGLEGMLKPLAPALMGMQMGMMIGFLSQTVHGQRHVGVPTAEVGDIFFVVPHIEAFAAENHLDPKQVRLWSAVHEVAHHVMLGGGWVRSHFQSLIRQYVDAMEVDVSSFEAIGDLNDPQRLQEMLGEGGGFPAMLSSVETSDTADEIAAFIAITSGYGEYLLERAAGELLPDLSAMRSAEEAKAGEVPGEETHLVTKLLGVQVTSASADQAAVFCAEVEDRWGPDSVPRVWEQSGNLPTLSELSDATGWAARVLLDDEFGPEPSCGTPAPPSSPLVDRKDK